MYDVSMCVCIPTLQRLTLVSALVDWRVSKLFSPVTSHLDNLGNSWFLRISHSTAQYTYMYIWIAKILVFVN